jgi:predicted Zn-dependent protease
MKRAVFCLTILAACLEATAVHAETAQGRMLLEQAQYWQQRGRADLAADAWRKLLKTEPSNREALTGLAQYEADAGRTESARNYLNQLKQAYPGASEIARLESRLTQTRVANADGALQEARTLAKSGQNEAAVRRYRDLLDRNKPAGDLGLEYYQTLAGSSGGWDEARNGLERLARENPSDARYALAYAQHLTYRESTRRKGIEQLATLSRHRDVGKQADASWRQALVWLNAKRNDAPLYRQYLASNADDAAIREKLEALTSQQATQHGPTDIYARERQEGFDAYRQGNLVAAETHFAHILSVSPRDKDALGGLGLVRLKQERFSESRDLLGKAAQSSGGERRWGEAYQSAAYWNLLQEGQAEATQGQLAPAEKKLRQAVRLNDAEPAGRIALGGVLLEGGKPKDAEAQYRAVLAREPQHADGIRGLISALIAQERNDEALLLADQLAATGGGTADGYGAIRAKQYRKQAATALEQGDPATALDALEQGLLAAPNDPWIRVDLAKLYQRQGRTAEARSLIDGLVDTYPDMPDALYASALLSADQQQWWDAINTMERIPEHSRTREMGLFQKRLWVHVQCDRATVLGRQGQIGAAQDILRQVEEAAGGDLEYMLAAAQTYAELGDTPRAIALARRGLAQTARPSATMRLQYAGLLMKTGQFAELDAVLRQIGSEQLKPQEVRALNDLRVAAALRHADTARENGDLAAAYDYLYPALADNPNDPRVQMALGRMYNAAGDYENAGDIYANVVRLEPSNMDARYAYVGVEMSLRNFEAAEAALNDAMSVQPENPRLIALAGRLALAQKQYDKAGQLFRLAQSLEQRQMARSGQGGVGLRLVGAGPQSGASPALNPFANRRPVTAPQGYAEAPIRSVAPIPPLTVVPDPGIATASRPARSMALPRTDTVPVEPQRFVQAAYPTQPEVPSPMPRRKVAEPTVQQEIEALNARNSSSAAGGLAVRVRNGEAGLGQLTEVETPVEGKMAIGYDSQVGVKVTPVVLDAGALPQANALTASRFGSNALAVPLANAADLPQRDSGVALNLSYKKEMLHADAGTSPLGFAVQNFVGGLGLQHEADDTKLNVEFSRRSVTDSLLSYAGATDPISGQVWGGVTATGMRAKATHEEDGFGIYGNAAFKVLNGRNVASNNMSELGGGVYWKLVQTLDDEVTAGVNLTTMHYQKNLRYFTLGQGGYFSPQSYVGLSLPFDYKGHSKRMTYQLGGSVGLQYFTESSSAYFPNNAAMQNSLQARTLANPVLGLSTYYPAQSTAGFGYRFYGGFEYQAQPRITLGGFFSLDNARNYTQGVGMAYLRYWIEPQKSKMQYQPSGVNPYFQEWNE